MFKFSSPPTLEVEARPAYTKKKIQRSRVVGDSKAGRQLRALNSYRSAYQPTMLTQDMIEWNAAIEAKKELRKRKKQMIRGSSYIPPVSG